MPSPGASGDGSSEVTDGGGGGGAGRAKRQRVEAGDGDPAGDPFLESLAAAQAALEQAVACPSDARLRERVAQILSAVRGVVGDARK